MTRSFDVERAVALWESGMRYKDISVEMNSPMSEVSAVLGGLGLHRDQLAARRRAVNLLAESGASVKDISDQVGLCEFTVSTMIRQMPARRVRAKRERS